MSRGSQTNSPVCTITALRLHQCILQQEDSEPPERKLFCHLSTALQERSKEGARLGKLLETKCYNTKSNFLSEDANP